METVGRYALNLAALLGHGTTAIVYKGHHSKTGENVAIKKIDKKLISKSHHVLSKEIIVLKELRNLKHRNIVSFLDCVENADHVYLIMEYCGGGDLSKYLNDFAPLKENVIAIFLQQIASALMVLHSKGIVHRDLKPQNILICKNEMQKKNPFYFTLKIADFGFARFLEEGMMAKTMCGTPLYMAPEVLLYSHYDGKADLWSVGTIAYQCLTGRPPFCARSQEELKQRYRSIPDVKSLLPSTASAELSNLLLGLLVLDPKKRMDFDEFFQHEFLTKRQVTEKLGKRFESVPLMTSSVKDDHQFTSNGSLERMYHSPVKMSPPGPKPKERENKESTSRPAQNVIAQRPNSPSLHDFVVVSKDEILNDERQISSSGKASTVTDKSRQPSAVHVTSPTPSTPVPIPLRARMFRHLVEDGDLQKTSSSPDFRRNSTPGSRDSPVPTFAKGPIPLLRRRSSSARMASVESLSPPSVQFMVGSPSSNSSRSNSPAVLTPISSASPLHQQGFQQNQSSQPRQLGFPSSSGNSPMYFSNFRTSSNSPSPPSQGVFALEVDSSGSFVAPELNERTLLNRVDVELIERFEFILDLSKCIMKLARAHSNSLSESLFLGSAASMVVNEKQRKIQQIQLYVYVLELLYSVLQLTQEMLKEEKLVPSKPLKQVVTEINECYHQCLSECKLAKQNGASSLISSCIPNPTSNNVHMTERLLFSCAIDLLRSGLSEDVVGNKQDCLQNYNSAYILLHSLARQALRNDDRRLLDGFRDNIERRLMNLHSRGFACIKK